MDTLRCCSNVA